MRKKKLCGLFYPSWNFLLIQKCQFIFKPENPKNKRRKISARENLLCCNQYAKNQHRIGVEASYSFNRTEMQQTFCSSVFAVPHTWVQWTGSNHRCRTAYCSSQTCLAVQGALPFSLFPEASSCAPCPEWTGGGAKGSCSLHLCGSFVDFPLPTCQAGTVLSYLSLQHCHEELTIKQTQEISFSLP